MWKYEAHRQRNLEFSRPAAKATCTWNQSIQLSLKLTDYTVTSIKMTVLDITFSLSYFTKKKYIYILANLNLHVGNVKLTQRPGMESLSGLI